MSGSKMRARALALACVSVFAIGLAACQPQEKAATGQVDPDRAPNPNAAAEIKKFLDTEINGLSTLPREQQEAELNWFVKAAAPYQGMEIKVVSETIATHEYESKVLAPAFTAIGR